MNSMQPVEPDRRAPHWLLPQWEAPASLRVLSTLRDGGVSRGPWGLADGSPGGWNLGAHCGDSASDVAENRLLLRERLPAEPIWLEQVHGTDVLDADRFLAANGTDQESRATPGTRPRADAAVTTRRGVVLAVLTADCLPVVLTSRLGTAVGVAHAGWRGLAGGVLENTVRALDRARPGERWIAWLGPAIGPTRYEVGDDVRDAFATEDAGAASAFAPAGAPGKWHADLYALARRRLARAGVRDVAGGGLCTASDPQRFYSYRRDGVTGRMASLAWIA
jgi:YfiH family protein